MTFWCSLRYPVTAGRDGSVPWLPRDLCRSAGGWRVRAQPAPNPGSYPSGSIWVQGRGTGLCLLKEGNKISAAPQSLSSEGLRLLQSGLKESCRASNRPQKPESSARSPGPAWPEQHLYDPFIMVDGVTMPHLPLLLPAPASLLAPPTRAHLKHWRVQRKSVWRVWTNEVNQGHPTQTPSRTGKIKQISEEASRSVHPTWGRDLAFKHPFFDIWTCW